MDHDALIDFVIQNFMEDGNFNIDKIADFIGLPKDIQTDKIKNWATTKIILLNDKKVNLDNIKQASEQRIDAEIVKLQTVI